MRRAPQRAVASLRLLRARGIDAWLRAQAERFACTCGRLLSNRDEACPACGRASTANCPSK